MGKGRKAGLLVSCLLIMAVLFSACGLLDAVLGPRPQTQQPAEQEQTQQSAGSAAKPSGASLSEELASTDKEEVPLVSESETIEVSIDRVLEYANSSNYVMEFAQKFFSDLIIYKDSSGSFTYKPVDPNLPQSDYDWNNLVPVGSGSREKVYIEDGTITSLKGIDVSRHQEEIDWEKVAADGVEFAVIRLGYRGYSQGVLQIDPTYEANITGALANDIAVGVYFWTQAATVEEAEEEAQFILDNIKPYRVTWPIVIDIEEGSGGDRTLHLTAEERTDCIVAFCEKIKDAGYTPMLYSNIRWFMEKLEIERLMDYDIWFAQYYNRPFFPYAFQMWQYTSSGRVDGIKGDVDLNLSFKDYRIKE